MDAGAKEERDPAWWGRRAWSLLSAVRARAPLVQCITNLVSMDIAANALLAAGASPAMVHSLREVPDFTPRCDAVYVNVGTLSEDWLPSMRAAASAGRPWVLDPVAAAASGFRMEACLELLALRPAVVRGNASEILALADRSVAASSNFKSDGSGCPFWHWEQSYAKYVEENATKLTFKGFDGAMISTELVSNAERNGQKMEEENIEISVLIELGRSLLVVGQEIAWLLRCVLVVCVVVVFVLGMLLVVQNKI
ncbi:unnamed protein product [Urochloa humidicola]